MLKIRGLLMSYYCTSCYIDFEHYVYVDNLKLCATFLSDNPLLIVILVAQKT